MKDGLDLGIISTNAFVKKGYSIIIANVGKTIALITLAVSAMVMFTKISFSGFGSESFTASLITMLIASYVMYFSLEDAGEKLGRDTDKYKSASKEHKELIERTKARSVASLRKFCLDYREAELEYRRNDLLFSLGYTKEEYEGYLKGAKISKNDQKALRRVKKIKRAELDAACLLSDSDGRKGELKSPERGRAARTVLRLIPSTVCMLFTISVMISVKDNMTLSGVIEAILKLSALPVIGLKGYSDGYEYVTDSEIPWIHTKIRLLDSFLKSNEKDEP